MTRLALFLAYVAGVTTTMLLLCAWALYRYIREGFDDRRRI